jgi:hypothetical protein
MELRRKDPVDFAAWVRAYRNRFTLELPSGGVLIEVAPPTDRA